LRDEFTPATFQRGLFTALVLVSLGVPAALSAEHHWQLPDASSGVIDGHPAALFWPAVAETAELLDPRGCEVHITKVEKTTESIYPCGDWFVPPVGRYIAWVESDQWMSPAPVVFSYGGGPARTGGARLITPVVPAGRVSVFFTGQPPRASSVRFLSLLGKGGHAIERRATLDETRRGIRMPAAGCLIGLFADDDSAVAISRPIMVKAHDMTNVKLASPTKPGVLAILRRTATGPVKVTIHSGAASFAPDVFLDAPGRVYAVWYALPRSAANLSIESNDLSLAPVPIPLDRRMLETVRKTMIARNHEQ
jgi:hypothetical protein